MRRSQLSIALGLATTVATFGANATETIYEGDSGVNVGIGLSSDILPRFLGGLDFNGDVENGKDFATPRPGTADVLGSGVLSAIGGQVSEDTSGQFAAEQRVWLNVSKGNLETHTMIEWDGVLDSGAIDDNDPNLERVRVSYTAPSLGAKFNVGADIFLATTIGRLVYVDDDPGVWVNGETSGVTWQVGYHVRDEGSGAAGDSAERAARLPDGRDNDLFSGRLGFSGSLGANSSWYLEPFALVENRESQGLQSFPSPQSTDMVAGYFGTGGRYKNGAFTIQGEFVTHQGEIRGTDTVSMRDGFNENFDEMDVSSFGAHTRFSLQNAIAGKLTPYFSWDWASGDSDPFDDDLEGFVPVGTSTALRADNIQWARKSVVNQMPNAVGNNAVEFGFETNTLGVGPSLGGIINTGVGANPGYHRLQAGLRGGLTGKWGVATRVSYLRFDETDAAVAGAQARGQDITDVDEEIGWGFDLEFPYQVMKEVSVTPFGSVFLPGDGAETLAGDDDIAFVSGFNVFASF